MATHVFKLPNSNPGPKRQIKVTAACKPCRNRRIGCDGLRPQCSRCQQRNDTACSYDTQTTEETRTQALKRKIDALEDRLDSVAQTLTALQGLPPHGASRLIADVLQSPNPMASLIEVGNKIQLQSENLSRQLSMLDSMKASFPDTKSSLQFQLYLCYPRWYPPLRIDVIQPAIAGTSNIDLMAWQAGRVEHLRLAVTSGSAIHIASWNLEIPKSCLEFWTGIPISTSLAERALNAFLRTDHVLFGFMDAELFLGDFASGGGRFCSKPLIAAVLHYSCLKLARFDDEAAAVLSAFRKETEVLLERDQPCSTNIAALNVHYTALVFSDGYECAAPFLDTAVRYCSTICTSTAVLNADDTVALSHAVWAVFASAIFRTHRWSKKAPLWMPYLPVPYLELGARSNVRVSTKADVEKIACQRYIFAAICSNLPFMRESVMMQVSGTTSDDARAAAIGSLYRRALDCAAKVQRPQRLHPELSESLFIGQMWSHLWILSLFQPLTHHRQPIPGFHGTAGSIFVASALQLQHLIFSYQKLHPLAAPTLALHGPVFVAAVALTQIRHVSERIQQFQGLLRVFADLAISFQGLRDLMQSLVLVGFEGGLVQREHIRSLHDKFSKVCHMNQRASLNTARLLSQKSSKLREIAVQLRDHSYDQLFTTSHVIDEETGLVP